MGRQDKSDWVEELAIDGPPFIERKKGYSLVEKKTRSFGFLSEIMF